MTEQKTSLNPTSYICKGCGQHYDERTEPSAPLLEVLEVEGQRASTILDPVCPFCIAEAEAVVIR